MNSYSKYKDSGVEWIGEIPSHWMFLPLKFLVETPVTDGPHETPEFIDNGVPFLSVESVVENKLVISRMRGYISRKLHEEYSKKCKPRKNDIFLVKSGSTTGKSAIVETDEQFNVWSPLCLIRSNTKKIRPQFFFQSLQSGYFRKSIELAWSFGTQPNIGMNVIENLKIILPTLNEQTLISQYLNKKTSQIDSLIEKIEKKIELLKEQRTSLINQCVTKGLNPDVEMKDSGIEWIGEIPNNWKVKKLKHVSNIETGTTPSTSNESFYDNIGTLWIKPDDLSEFKPITSTNQRLTTYGVQDSRPLPPNSVLVCGIGSIGKFGFSENTVCTNQQINGVSFDKEEVVDRYGLYLISSLKSEFQRVSEKVVVSILNKTRQKNVEIPIPSPQEQVLISQYLDKKTSQIDSLVEKEAKRIELLKEYRQSLISNIVTGKIRVMEEMI